MTLPEARTPGDQSKPVQPDEQPRTLAVLGDVPLYVQVPFPVFPEQGTTIYNRARRARRIRGSRPVMMYPQLIEHLGIEETVTYLRLALWHECGEELSIERLADELWFGSTERATHWVHALIEHNLLITDEEFRAAHEAEWAEHVAEVEQRQAERQARLGNATYLDGRWAGGWPLVRGDGPPKSVSVVYFQHDADDRLAYIGSTHTFQRRMENHAKTARAGVWVRWEARECAARDEAYVIEEREIAERKPYQNAVSVPPVARPRARRTGVR
jgi:hypothetical protein